MNESEIRRRAEAFAAEAQDAESRATVREWLDAARAQELRDAFEVSLTFGTAGLRAPMGIGTGRMNRVCVRRAVTALCEELETLAALDSPSATLCVGYDGRRQSTEFAEDAIRTARELGFQVHAFQRPIPTPVLAFATRHLDAAAGLMITASHNPPKDNGIKVFWRGGRQVLPPHDAAIATRLKRLDEVGARPSAEPRGTVGRLVPLGDAMVEAYLEAVRRALPQAPSGARHPSVTYSALGGVGAEVTRRVLADLGVTEVHEVPEECRIDPAFAGLASPNPEHSAALVRALSLAEQTGSDLMLVHDPDADRLAVAVRHGGALVRLTGDDVGVLLAEFRLSQHRRTQAAVITTAVSSELLGPVAAAYGALHARVSTGLKWVCRRGREFEAQQGATYLFGYEEALGYCLPELGDDKDGIAALALVVLLYAHLKERDQTLVDALHDLYRTHGVHRTRQVTWDFAEEAERRRVLGTLREAPPATLAGRTLSSAENDPHTPDLTVLRYADDLRLVLRPSGTEPKLKAYLEVRTPPPAAGALPEMLDAAEAALDHAASELASLV